MVMKLERLLLSIVALFAFVFVYEWVYHGILLHDLYAQTTLLRSEEAMQGLFHWAVIIQLLFVFVITMIYARYTSGKGIDEGVRFGLYVGLLLGIVHFGMYPVMPISLALALALLVGYIIEGIGIGLVLALTYRGK